MNINSEPVFIRFQELLAHSTAGIYTVTIRDALLSTFDVTVTITQPVVLSATTAQVNVKCFGGATGTSTATPAGGTGPFTYSWNTLPVQTTATATGMIAGPYTRNSY